MTCADVRESLGAYVVGALDESEATAVRSHLSTCTGCRAEAESLGAVAALLAHAPEEGFVGVEQRSAGLEHVLARAAAERRKAARRRVLVGLAAAAVVAVLAGVGGAALRAATSPAPAAVQESPTAVASGRDESTGVAASVGVTRRGWGSALTLELVGAQRGEQCQLVAEARDGGRQVAATWSVPQQGYPGGTLRVNGAVGLQPDLISRFVVETLAGQPLVSTSEMR